ncbi:sigma-70 family RNA polymerase sigma factor [Amycolatopsis sp. CA-126428]|uniref:sigma-70 family RNA polymerase sigma factor n=1 Tax=Amycolatopsis sp. CA-126428 TaxID=2073158 RepID=UPI000CCFF9F2|nr:sigma-70 family RNA polymerase sigma factor [Amycolatopsis sp. CA-126428]
MTEDERLLRALYDEHAGAVRRYALSLMSGDVARADDVVQETFLRAWKTPAVLDQSRNSSRPWLFTVAKRLIIDEWRSGRRRYEKVTDEPPEVPTADRTDAVGDRTVVAQALSRLSQEHRSVLLETYLRGSSLKEAAARLGVPLGTIKSRTHYALHAFAAAVADLGGV